MKLDINKWQSTKSFPTFDIKNFGYHNWRSEIKLFYIHPSGKTLQFKAGDDIDTSMSKASILQQSFGGVIIYNTSEASFYEITRMISEYELEIFPNNIKEYLNITDENLKYDVDCKSDYEFNVKDFSEWLNNKYQITDPSTFYLNGKNFPANDDISYTQEQISDWLRDSIEDYYKDQYNMDITKRCVIIEPDRMMVSDSEFAFENYGLYMKKMFSSVIKENKVGSSNLILNIPEKKQGKLIKSIPHSLYEELSQLDNTLLDTSSIKVPEQRKHHELYESQEWALEQLQKHGSGFQMLAGEVGVGKTHIASSYVNDYLKDNPNAKILIVEPVKEVIPKFEQLIDNLDNVTITDDVKQLNHEQWDVVLFDEMHKQNNKTVKDFPRKTKHYPDVVIGMTGTVSDMKPQEVYQITKNYEIKNIELYGGSVQTHLSSQSVLSKSPQTYHQQLMQYQQLPEAYVNNILKPVDLLRSDVKELNLESRMPVNKYQAGFELSPKDKAFYNLLSMRANVLNMSKDNQIEILDQVLNTNQSEIVIQPSKNFNTKKVQYELVDYADELESTHDLLYLGKRDIEFKDKKVDFIKQTINHVDGKVLLYLTSDNHQEHLMKDLQAEGIDVEYVDTNEDGAVQKINESQAKIVAFNVLPIREGVDLEANTVMWYNTPPTAGIDEQACGRITRLTSSAEEKNIYYLYNKTTVQEEMVNEIIQTNNVNNMALKRDNYNIQQL